MEPQLIEPSVLKKLYKKRLELNNKNFFADTFSNIWMFIKKNWIGIAIVMFVISIMVYFYIDKQKSRFDNNIIIEEPEPEEDNQLHGGYEAEYYKMLPRVMPPPPESYDASYDVSYDESDY